MNCVRSAGVVLLVLLAVSLLTRITDQTGTPPRPESVQAEIRAGEILPGTEIVDLRNGNIHLQIPIRATTKNH